MNDSPLKIYLSASISNELSNAHLADLFPSGAFKIYLPQKIVPTQLNDTQFPLTVYEKCIEMMKDSDICLLLLDAYGRDCAWEAGWYTAHPEKLLVAFVQASSIFLRDWMTKGGIDVLITTNPRLFTTCQKNPILSTKQLFFIEKEDMLPEIIQKIYQNGALSCS